MAVAEGAERVCKIWPPRGIGSEKRKKQICAEPSEVCVDTVQLDYLRDDD